MAKKLTIAVTDAETDPFKYNRVPEPFVWGFYDGFDYFSFWGEDGICTESLIEHVYENEYIIYAHNGGKFDFFFLLPYFEPGSIQLINGRISSAKIGGSTLRDSYNIIPVPQRMFGKDEIDYWKMEREHRNKYRPEILSYLQTDCLELYDKVTAFCDRFGRKLTLASAAMTELKKTVEYKTRRSFERFSEQQDERFRPYYYGGRCEAFKKGELKPNSGDWHVYDINSAYPFAMLHKHPDPTWNSFYVSKSFPKHTQAYFAKIKAISKGALPWRDPNGDGKLDFPNDNIIREYFVTGWEIQAGLDTKTLKIIEILEARIPDRVIDFSEYVEKYYEEKKEGKASKNKTKELFAKLLLNSAYGKFALNPREYKEYVIVEYGDDPPDTDKYTWFQNSSYPEYGIDIYERKKHKAIEEYADPEEYENLRGFYNVAVAASITGFVRAYLWRAICNSENPIYCDTDSITCEKFHGELGLELGQWKWEGSGDLAYIAGRKTYAIRITDGEAESFSRDKYGELKKKKATVGERWKVASKGARLEPEEIIKMVRDGETVNWENPSPTFSLRFGTRFLNRKVKMT